MSLGVQQAYYTKLQLLISANISAMIQNVQEILKQTRFSLIYLFQKELRKIASARACRSKY